MPQKPESDAPQRPRFRGIGRSELILAACMIVGSAIYLYDATSIRLSRFSDPLGPRAFPYLIGILGLISAVWLLAEAYFRAPRTTSEAADPVALSTVGFVVGWSLLFFASFDAIDFLIACPVYLLGLTMFFNRNAWVINLMFSVAVSVLLYLAFAGLLGVPLSNRLLTFDF